MSESAPAVARGCIFCGRKPTTNEHIFPKWTSEILKKDPRGLRWPLSLTHQRDGTERTWSAYKEIAFRAKCVCRDCNHGWMNEIEQAAQPFVAPMIKGDRVGLDQQAQSIVAAWCALKSVVARYAHSPVNPVERSWREYLYRHHSAPEMWYIWLTSYHGDKAFHYNGHDITLSFPGPTPADAISTPHGVLATFIIGYLAFKVFGVREGTLTYPGPDVLLKIWPISEGSVEWPTLRTITDGTLPSFENMFLI